MAASDTTIAGAGTTLAITGMTCSGCVNAVTRVLSLVPGVTRASVDLDAGRARVEGGAAPEALIAAVERAGYGARVAEEGKEEPHHGHGRRSGGC